MITVDYVTEPGVLQGHHLITRLTENNGNFTFDAQVRLDFKAVGVDGRLIWDPNDLYYGQAITGSIAGPSNGRLLADLELSVIVNGVVSTFTVPAANTANNANLRDLISDFNQAILAAGLDTSIAARLSGNQISLVPADSGSTSNSILQVSFANAVAASLGFTAGQLSTAGYIGSNGLSSLLPSEGDFLAIIIDALDGDDTITVGPTVVKSVWTDGGAGNDRIEYISGSPILIDQTDARNNGVGNGDQAHAFDLAVAAAPSNPSGFRIAGQYRFTGLTIDSPSDEDWYAFKLGAAPSPANSC